MSEIGAKKTTVIVFSLILISAFLLPSLFCLAQSAPGDSLNQTLNAVPDLPTVSLSTYLGRIIGAALALSGTIFLCLIIYGGFVIMTSAGNVDRAAKGKKVIYWAIIGVLIIGAAYAITSFVFSAILQ